MAPWGKAEMADYREKKGKRGSLVFAGNAVSVLKMRTTKRNCKETGGYSLLFFSVSLLKDLTAVLLFLCGKAEVDCT